MKILWFPRLELDIDKLHITTWREMCNELEKLGCIVKIAVAGKDINKVIDRSYIKIILIRVKFLRTFNFWISGYIKFLLHFLKFKPDLVILDIFSIWFSFPFALLPKRKCTFIVDNRTPFYNSKPTRPTTRDKVMRIYSSLAYKYCKFLLDGMTVITTHFKQQIVKDIDINESKIGVWGSGVDLAKFSEEECSYHENNHIFRGKFVIMQHGQISLNRGIMETIKALHFIENEDIILVLIGEIIGNSMEKDELNKIIKALKLEDRIRIVPPVPFREIPKYISMCDCAILAYPNIEYWNNNNPIKLLEYLAMKKVVICTDMWTFRDVAEDKKCVYYIENNNPENIARAISYCYENRSMLGEWGRIGAEIIEEKYTWNKQAINLLNFVERIQS